MTPTPRPPRAVTAFVAVVSLAVTVCSALAVERGERDREQARFDRRSRDAEAAITGRMETCTHFLRAAAAYYNATGTLSRQGWVTFVGSLDLREQYPGTRGLGFMARVRPGELAAHEALARREAAAYHVHPVTPGVDLFPIRYFEPLDPTSRWVIGFDASTEPTRRAAMERARDTGQPALSNKLGLLTARGETDKPAFTIYCPVFRHGQPVRTVEERRQALAGFVYSPFRATDLFDGIFKGAPDHGVGFAIYDGPAAAPDRLLYDHNLVSHGPAHPSFTGVRHVALAGRTWTIALVALPSFDSQSTGGLPLYTLLAGLLVSLLLTGTAWALASSRERAERLVARRTEELQQANEDLAQVDRMKDQFLGILSHELRTPINAIMGFGSILADGLVGELAPPQQATLEKILVGADVLLALVNDLLDMSRIQAGKFLLDPAPMTLDAAVHDSLGQLAGLAQKKGLRLSVDVEPGLPRLEADVQRVMQVFSNLIGNAIKFTPEGGSITVRARRDGEVLRCEVADTGIGIALEDQARIFAPFTQLDAGNTRKAGGTGLGLGIVKALVEAHGGTVGLTSSAGNGATFWFTLPLAGAGVACLDPARAAG